MTKNRPPRRVQLRERTYKRLPPNTVKVDGTSEWATPYFVFNGQSPGTGVGEAGRIAVASRHQAVDLYREMTLRPEWAHTRAIAIEELSGKNLACWCPLPKRGKSDLCHASVLIEIANAASER